MGKFLEDFKAFALKGNVVDMAVGLRKNSLKSTILHA